MISSECFFLSHPNTRECAHSIRLLGQYLKRRKSACLRLVLQMVSFCCVACCFVGELIISVIYDGRVHTWGLGVSGGCAFGVNFVFKWIKRINSKTHTHNSSSKRGTIRIAAMRIDQTKCTCAQMFTNRNWSTDKYAQVRMCTDASRR